MIFVILLAGALLAVALPSSSIVDPNAIALIRGDDPQALVCDQPETPTASLDQKTPPRGESAALAGSYVCRRPIFAASERDPFIGRVLKAESEKAKRIALEVRGRLLQNGTSLAVVGEGLEDSRITQTILAVYRTELVRALGANRVEHLYVPESDASVLRIHLRANDAPELMSLVRLQLKASDKEQQWLVL